LFRRTDRYEGRKRCEGYMTYEWIGKFNEGNESRWFADDFLYVEEIYIYDM
jgi:hypothetical protein